VTLSVRLPNKSASTPFKVKTTVAPTASVYGTGPTTAPSVRFRMVPRSYWQPTAQDGSGNPVANQPPGVNTTQYWNKTPYTVNAGAMAEQLTNSTGFPVRNLVFVLRDSNGSRSQGESDFPDPFKLQLQSNIIVDRLKSLWKNQIGTDYGYTGAVGDTAGSKDNGVYVVPFCKDSLPEAGLGEPSFVPADHGRHAAPDEGHHLGLGFALDDRAHQLRRRGWRCDPGSGHHLSSDRKAGVVPCPTTGLDSRFNF
jgi:hypothetical protein